MSRAVLVVPVFNEADRFDPHYWIRLRQVTDVGLHFVDDGSTDGSTATLDHFCAASGSSVRHLDRNVGKANAVRLGLLDVLESGSGDPVGFIDADGVFGADDVRALLSLIDSPELNSFQAFFSSRVALSGRDIDRRTTRHYIGRVVATILSSAYEPMPYDSQSGLKLFRVSEILRDCLHEPFETKWFFELELLIRWRAETGAPMPVWEEPVSSWFDAPGSKITGWESLRVPREIYRVLSLARRK